MSGVASCPENFRKLNSNPNSDLEGLLGQKLGKIEGRWSDTGAHARKASMQAKARFSSSSSSSSLAPAKATAGQQKQPKTPRIPPWQDPTLALLLVAGAWSAGLGHRRWTPRLKATAAST